MQIGIEEIGPKLARITLTGRLDVVGTDAVDLQCNAIAGSSKGVIADLAGVSFLSSIGIRMLISCSTVMERRGGKMVLLSPQPQVYEVLEVTGVLDLLTVMADDTEAMRAIGA